MGAWPGGRVLGWRQESLLGELQRESDGLSWTALVSCLHGGLGDYAHTDGGGGMAAV